MKREDYSLKILHMLMNADGFLKTNQICDKLGCERKTVYAAMDRLETSGFGIEVVKIAEGRKRENQYKFLGMFGF